MGRMIWMRDPKGNYTDYTYDSGGRLETVTNRSMGFTTTYTYNNADELIQIEDANGQLTRYEYDNAGRQEAVISNYVDGTFNPAEPDVDVARILLV